MKQVFCFTCRGHPNITARHRSTIEVTKDPSITPSGDCIVGVLADFVPADLQRFLQDAQRLSITFSCNGERESVLATYNPLFEPCREIVIRRGPFSSSRTIATHADRSCLDFSRGFVEMIKNPAAIISVIIRKL